MISLIPRKTLIVGFSKFGCCKPTTLLKKLHHSFVFEFCEFSQNRNKEQLLLNTSEHISKEVKQVLEERWRDRSFNGTAKENKVSH